MKKYIVLSVNDNPKYLAYVPLVVWAWRQFGWEPIIFFNGEAPKLYVVGYRVPYIEGYGSDTLVQVSRLYGASVIEKGYLMTGDIDMIPLSSYWEFNEEKITVWGHDLTGYQHMPICYIGMKASLWRDVMKTPGLGHYELFLERDLDSMPNAKSEDSVKRWVVDQDLITERINESHLPKETVIRGVYENGYPIGRVDRSAWTLKHNTFIDCHGPHDLIDNPESRRKLFELLKLVWPREDFTWYNYYLDTLK